MIYIILWYGKKGEQQGKEEERGMEEAKEKEREANQIDQVKPGIHILILRYSPPSSFRLSPGLVFLFFFNIEAFMKVKIIFGSPIAYSMEFQLCMGCQNT